MLVVNLQAQFYDILPGGRVPESKVWSVTGGSKLVSALLNNNYPFKNRGGGGLCLLPNKTHN